VSVEREQSLARMRAQVTATLQAAGKSPSEIERACIEICEPLLEQAQALANTWSSDRRYGRVPSWVIDHVSPYGIAVFALLSARYTNRDGLAFPSRATIAKDLGISVPTVDKAIQELVTARAVHRERRAVPNSRNIQIVYTLIYDYGTYQRH
jgi:hypothetical protein